MILGILSDTHKKAGRAIKAIDMLVENGARHLIHAGDIGREEILAYMAGLGVPYTAVLGNNDKKLEHLQESYNLFREPHYFSIDGISFKLMHHPWFLSPDADVVVFGHTHKFSYEYRGDGRLFLNPGEVCARNKPVSEAVLLRMEPEIVEVTHCQRRIKESAWQYNKIVSDQIKCERVSENV